MGLNHTSMGPPLQLEHFSYSIGGKTILRDVSLTVNRGEYLSIVGPNGAGKTTLLKCIQQLIPGGEGTIKVKGRPVKTYSPRELARFVAYVPQADGRIFPFTVEQFVTLGRYPYLSPFLSIDAEGQQVVRTAMELTGVERFVGRTMDTLSGGERQKVYLAAAVAQNPEILLLDEPTTFLDYRHQREIQEVLARLRENSHLTILSVTHDLNRAVLESDRILALREGVVVFQGSPQEIMRPEVLQSIYQCSFLLVNHPQARIAMIVPAAPSELLSL